MLRRGLAGVLGGVLGVERELSGKSAEVRTHRLVCVGSAAFVMIPQMSRMRGADTTRVMQGVITGIGFLGAGAMLKNHDESAVTGLTTAAGIWVTAASGLAAGL